MLLLGVRTYRVEGEESTVTKPRFYFPKSKQKRSVAKRSGNEEGEVWKEMRVWSVTEAFLRDWAEYALRGEIVSRASDYGALHRPQELNEERLRGGERC